MKRLFVAAALLALTAALCVGCRWTLDSGVDTLLAEVDAVESAYRTGGRESALPAAERLAARFSEETRLFPLFLPHEKVEEAALCADALPVLLREEDTAFAAELARCRRLLEQLADSERLSAENLL